MTAECGNRIESGVYKAIMNFAKGDVLCGTLCSISIRCEVTCTVITWVPLPAGKFTSIALLKGVSHGTRKFRDMCA